ncbi:MAG: ACP S-malonyltransferase [Actinomycetota bacterium]
MKYAVLFPGQGSQTVGMCADARRERPDLVGPRASEIVGWDINALIDEGTDDDLTKTQHAQPGLYAVSYALWSVFADSVTVAPTAGAGHSLGEYTALAAAQALGYYDGLSLVAQRGNAMAMSASESSSGMAALLGADIDKAEEIAALRRSEGGALYVANINAPGQIVVAGGTEDLDWLAAEARGLGIRRAIILKVAGGFHSPFMASAAESLGEALDATTINAPTFDVYANVTGLPTTNPRASLGDQLTSTVRFAETLVTMSEAGIDTFVHVGPGDVTAGLAKRTVKGATVHVVSTTDEARAIADLLSVE